MQTPPRPTTGLTENVSGEPHHARSTPSPAGPSMDGLSEELADYAQRVMAATGLTAGDLIAVASTDEASGLNAPDRAEVDAVIGQALRAGWAAVTEQRHPRQGIDSDDSEGHQR